MDSCSYTKIKSVDIESYDPDLAIYPTKTAVAPEAAAFIEEQKKRRRRGCLKTCLCVTLGITGLLVFLALLAGFFAYTWMAGHVKALTVTQPVELPVVHVSNEDLEVFKDEAKLFFDLIQAGQVPDDFVATADNLNGLAATSDFLRGNAFASMEENKVTFSLSLPMDGFPGGKGRFLVATETVTWDPDTSVLHAKMVSPEDKKETQAKTFYDIQLHLSRMDDGKLNLVVLSGECFGHVIPQEWIDKHQNILEDLYDCDDDDDDCKHARKFIDGVEEIALQEKQVVFRGRGDGSIAHGGYRRLSSEPYELGWKGQLIRRLASL